VKKHYGSDNMQKLQSEYTGKGVVWLTIDSNAPGTEGNLTPEQAQKVMASWKTKQTALLLDPESNVAKLYGAKNTPDMVVINPEGKIVYEGAIDSKASPNPADIPSSTNYVKAALDESLAGKTVSKPTTKPYGCSVKYKSSYTWRDTLRRVLFVENFKAAVAFGRRFCLAISSALRRIAAPVARSTSA
jgi:hypothetical protein